MGKPIQAALYDAETYATSLLRSWAGFADKLLVRPAPLNTGMLSFNVYEPRGVIGAITPWNFPSVNAVYKFGPALAAGNTMVLKPSEVAPSSALRLAELALEAGVPEGVLNVVPGVGATVGTALAMHPDVDMLTFTGSTATVAKSWSWQGARTASRCCWNVAANPPRWCLTTSTPWMRWLTQSCKACSVTRVRCVARTLV